MSAIDSIAQSRSNFQIKNFVLLQHDVPERQYQQCLIELNQKLNNIKRQEIEMKRLVAKLDKETDEDERTLIELNIEELAFSLKSQMREAGTLYTLFREYPKYTYEQLQDAEAGYWVKRLARQAEIDVLQRTSGIGAGNLDALRQAGLINGFAESFLENTLPTITQQKALQ